MANAGHNLPYVCHRNEVAELLVRGMPLGLMPEMDYEEIETQLDFGGVIVFMSDGLAESHFEGEMFGTGRVQSSLVGRINDPLSAALDAHRHFVGEHWEKEDDMTVVTVGRTELVTLDDPESFNWANDHHSVARSGTTTHLRKRRAGFQDYA